MCFPTLVDIRIACHELALPPKLTRGYFWGFTLYGPDHYSGTADELVELAKTNPRQLQAA
jgi:pyruvate dehydrogenase (quinone)